MKQKTVDGFPQQVTIANYIILSVLIILLTIGGTAQNAKAEIVTFAFTGTVDYIHTDYQNLFGPSPTLTGYYSFDSETDDDSPELSYWGFYLGAMVELQFSIGNLTGFRRSIIDELGIERGNVIFVGNDLEYWNPLDDYYEAQSSWATTLGDVFSPMEPDRIFLRLVDETHSLFEDDSLPLTPPDLSDLYYRQWSLDIGDPYTHFSIASGEITSLTLLVDSLSVGVDIMPGVCPNPLNTKSKGILNVAVLGAADFDVAAIDPTTVRIEGVAPIRSSIRDKASPVIEPQEDCDCTTDMADGLNDLVLKFRNNDLITVLGDVQNGDTLELKLTGLLTDGTPIEGKDCVIIKKKK